jgi:hypothetical protein
MMYIGYIQYILYLSNFNSLPMVTVQVKKRKNIDLPEKTFRSLSVLAAANGKNLKAYIENVLEEEAKLFEEEEIYHVLLKNPETQEILTDEEKSAFENWLGA